MSPERVPQRIEVRIAGRLFEGWLKGTVTAGLDRACRSFSLTVSDKPWRVRPGDPCEILVAGALVVTGYVNRVAPRFDGRRHEIEVAGRSRTQDLVDCAPDLRPGQWDDRRVEQIAADFAAPFGLSVVTETDTGAPIPTFNLDQGETAFDAIEGLCRLRAVIATDDAAGNLVLTNAGRGGSAGDALVFGQNLLGGAGVFDDSQRFSEYLIKGQEPASDFKAPEQARSVIARAADSGLARYRPLLMVSTDPIDIAAGQREVDHQAAVRFGQAGRVDYTVAGWTQSGGALWRPNLLVQVQDPFNWLSDTWLIAAVSFEIGNDSGEITHLTVTRPEAFDRIPRKLSGDGEGGGDPWASLKVPVPLEPGS